MSTEIKKGYDSLKQALDESIAHSPGLADIYRRKFQWVLDRARQYAEFCHTDRDTVLEAWENARDYWFVNYYQDCNQPDLEKSQVLFIDDWMEKGRKLFGDDPLDWKFKCPACCHVQTMRQFKDAGEKPDLAYINCASRYGLGGLSNCNWSMGGLFKIGGQYVIDKRFVPHLVFDFAK